MKNNKINISIILVVFLMLSSSIFATEKERVEKKTYKVNSNTELKIKNSFGNINIESYSGNEIFIEVKIWAKGRSEKKVINFINSIGVDFNKSGNTVSLKTSNITNNRKVDQFKIDIDIKVPITNKLDIDNSFGNLFIGDHKGEIDLDISHGNFEISSLPNPNNEIDLNFGNGTIGYINSCELNVSHSSMQIKKVSNLILESDFSNNLIDEVEKAIKAEVSHGKGLEIKKLNKEFKFVEIEAEFSKIDLNLRGDFPYTLLYKGSFSSFKKPDGFNIINRDKDYTSETISGECKDGGSKIKVKMSHSSLK